MMYASEYPDRPSGLRVLLVEDENLIALLLEDMLADLGHTVIGPLARLDKALEAAQREEFDVAILDVNINGGDTYPIAEALAVRDIPFFFSTGYGKNSLRAPYRDCPTLQKPFQQDDLQKLFGKVLPKI
jgi:CheY-like chemotaxis protein